MGIVSGNMGVLLDRDAVIGTGCFDGNHITGVYVLPNFQKQDEAAVDLPRYITPIFKLTENCNYQCHFCQ